MPNYDWSCPSCGKLEDVFAHIDETVIVCPVCKDKIATRLFSPPRHIITDIEPYFDDNLGNGGQWVMSRQHKKQLLKQQGLEIRG